MNGAQVAIAELWREILDASDWRVVLERRLPGLEQERDWIAGIARRCAAPGPPMEPWESWLLYALSRLSDRVLCRAWEEGDRDLDVWRSMMGWLGFTPLPPRAFHPILHEVVEVEPGGGDWAVTARLWPGWRLGTLVFGREGVRARAPEDVDAETLTRGTLYWAHARPGRPTYDLSVGWGHNSQWRTRFRVDHVHAGRAWFNVGVGVVGWEREVSEAVAREVVRYRAFPRPPACYDPGAWDLSFDEPFDLDPLTP